MKKNFLLKGLFAAALFCFSTTVASAQQHKENKSDMTQAEIDAAVQSKLDAGQLQSTNGDKKAMLRAESPISNFNSRASSPSGSVEIDYVAALAGTEAARADLVNQQAAELVGSTKHQELANKIAYADAKIVQLNNLIN